jgi:hypothetical protein
VLASFRTPAAVGSFRERGAPHATVGSFRERGAPHATVGSFRELITVGSFRERGGPRDAVGSFRERGAPPAMVGSSGLASHASIHSLMNLSRIGVFFRPFPFKIL